MLVREQEQAQEWEQEQMLARELARKQVLARELEWARERITNNGD